MYLYFGNEKSETEWDMIRRNKKLIMEKYA